MPGTFCENIVRLKCKGGQDLERTLHIDVCTLRCSIHTCNCLYLGLDMAIYGDGLMRPLLKSDE